MRALTVCLISFLALGCASLESKIIGTYKPMIDTTSPATGDKLGVAFVQGFLSMASLEIRKDHTASITMMSETKISNWSLNGDVLTVDEFSGKPLRLRVSKGGERLTAIDDGKSKDQDVKLTFFRQ